MMQDIAPIKPDIAASDKGQFMLSDSSSEQSGAEFGQFFQREAQNHQVRGEQANKQKHDIEQNDVVKNHEYRKLKNSEEDAKQLADTNNQVSESSMNETSSKASSNAETIQADVPITDETSDNKLSSTELHSAEQENFDWVSYVTDHKAFSGDASVQAESIAVENVSPTEGDKKVKITDAVIDGIDIEAANLQAILKAQGLESEKDLSMHPDVLKEFDQAVADIIQKLTASKTADEQKANELSLDNQENDVLKNLDQDLLKNLLVASEPASAEKQDDLKSAIVNSNEPNTETNRQLEELELKVSAVNIGEYANESANVSVENEIATVSSLTNLSTTEQKSQQLANEAEANQDLPRDDLLASNVTRAFGNQATDVISKVPSPVSTQSLSKNNVVGLEAIAQLPDEKLGLVADNIQARINEIAPDLQVSAQAEKSFVAALQAGLKEFKDQLKQGREPGIDLKGLVTEALQKAEIPIPQNLDAAVDKQLSQVSNLFGLANALGQTTAQQQMSASSFNLADIHLQKETNQSVLDSNKASQSQLAQDKPVNIFKSEGQQQLADRVRWMVGNGKMTAEVRLDPPDLGGVNIRVTMNGDAASVSFTVQSQQARDALDQAAPRLRDMLQEQGIELGQSSVQQESQQQSSGEQTASQNTGSNGSVVADEAIEENAPVLEQRVVGGRIGGIDYYA